MPVRFWTAVPHRSLHHGIWSDPNETRAEYVAQIVDREIWHASFFRAVRHARFTLPIGLPGFRGLGNTYWLSESCSFFHSDGGSSGDTLIVSLIVQCGPTLPEVASDIQRDRVSPIGRANQALCGTTRCCRRV